MKRLKFHHNYASDKTKNLETIIELRFLTYESFRLLRFDRTCIKIIYKKIKQFPRHNQQFVTNGRRLATFPTKTQPNNEDLLSRRRDEIQGMNRGGFLHYIHNYIRTKSPRPRQGKVENIRDVSLYVSLNCETVVCHRRTNRGNCGRLCYDLFVNWTKSVLRSAVNHVEKCWDFGWFVAWVGCQNILWYFANDDSFWL